MYCTLDTVVNEVYTVHACKVSHRSTTCFYMNDEVVLSIQYKIIIHRAESRLSTCSKSKPSMLVVTSSLLYCLLTIVTDETRDGRRVSCVTARGRAAVHGSRDRAGSVRTDVKFLSTRHVDPRRHMCENCMRTTSLVGNSRGGESWRTHLFVYHDINHYTHPRSVTSDLFRSGSLKSGPSQFLRDAPKPSIALIL